MVGGLVVAGLCVGLLSPMETDPRSSAKRNEKINARVHKGTIGPRLTTVRRRVKCLRL